MISSLDISAVGVIEHAHLEFGSGLTVVTGETGAGKTMVLTSVQLLLGGRADAALVRRGAQQASVDGIFTVPQSTQTEVEDFGGIVEDGELIVGRTVPASGRSRAHVGSRPVPAATLGQVLRPLVTIHGQSDQVRLSTPQAQRTALDEFGGSQHAQILADYAEAWSAAVTLKRQLDAATVDHDRRVEDITSLTEALDEIDRADPYEGEDDELADLARRLTNAQDLRVLIGTAIGLIDSDDGHGALGALRDAGGQVRSAQRFDGSLEEYGNRLESYLLDVEGLRDDLSSYLSGLDSDPARLNEVQDRRATLRRLMEGRASDIAELLQWREQARARLAELTRPGSDPESIRRELTAAQQRVLDVGKRLSASRAALADRLSTAVDAELHALAMPDAHVRIDLPSAKPSSHGLEDVVFLLQSHPSAPERPLGQGASGGELSRVMLALEVILGRDATAETFIFDEVDAGIGGQTATEVGARLARLAEERQVIVVTHLAQVAAFASRHLVVSKADGLTTVTEVTGEQRHAELTRMMGGDPHSKAARRHAIEVLGSTVPQSQ
ncbi:DNA repair protein RecN [Schaalia sp. ZJ405]|uniref:DNA repair protein RecN n=1 Tax=Schaalia sp. ZJ405 TaxID=2709403 RepID=UPI0013EC5273|nr:DNA repair protein RecN [Schaalia sp. ZJ405]QPK82039.1 DNA repair protein RecN [Schaalia sp. ZJ405]